jgi:DNA polymerase-3 subunit chi
MTEILFYHLERQPLETALPKLLERTLDRGWKAVVQAASPERVEALDALLWTYDETSFLPHAAAGEPDSADEPIVLTTAAHNPNQAEVRFLVEGAEFPAAPDAYARIVVLFDGGDDEALAAARVLWKRLKGEARDLTYWRQSDAGRWEKMA